MAYEADPDESVRGVGAIASRDADNPRRQAIRAARARATLARDRQMSRVSYQPRGGMGPAAMGAINQAVISGVWAGYPSDAPPLTKVYSGAGGMPIQTLPPAPRPVLSDMPPPPKQIDILPPPPMPTPIAQPPSAAPPPIATPVSPTYVPSGVLMGGKPNAMPTPVMLPPIAIPDLTSADVPTSISPAWVLLGVGVAALLLFGKSAR